MITVKTLSRLYFRQLFRYRKSELFALIAFLIYGWVGVLALSQHQDRFPLWLFFLVVILADFVMFKLLSQKDSTVMDAFLKTRPVPRRRWLVYVVLCQCWNHFNLMMPLILLPFCLSVFPTGTAFLAFAGLYVVSVAGGLLNILIKRRGPYGKENAVRVNSRQSLWGSRFGSGTFGIQVKGFLRSKLVLPELVMFGVFLYQFFLRGRMDASSGDIYLFMALFCSVLSFPQYGLAIEACFFNGIWTRPVPVRRILTDKYIFSLMCTGILSLVCLPVVLIVHVPVLNLLVDAIFCGGFCTLVVLADAFSCRPYDPFAVASFKGGRNGQSAFRCSTFLLTMAIMIGYVVLRLTVSKPVSTGILLGLGILALCIHKPFFARRERKFLANRYYYMEDYTNR